MKCLFYISVLLFTTALIAQKAIVKEVDYNNQNIELQLQDIDLLEIDCSDEQKVSISMQDYAENPTQIEIKSEKDLIVITAVNITPLQNDVKTDKFCYEQPLFPTYKLTIPQNCVIAITYTNGNVEVHNFKGNMNLRLNTGDVAIEDFEGSINTELFSGNVNVTIKNTEATIHTNQGRITSTFPTTDWKISDISLFGTLGVKKNLLNVKSIYANILLNSSTTQ